MKKCFRILDTKVNRNFEDVFNIKVIEKNFSKFMTWQASWNEYVEYKENKIKNNKIDKGE